MLTMKDTMDIFTRNVIGITKILQKKKIGIAGCGGLGSNIAVSLVRAGVKNLVLVDFDIVEASNLNRQHFFLQDIGKYKVKALADHLYNINKDLNLTIINKKISKEDIVTIYDDCDILLEAFDNAESKKWLIEKWAIHYPKKAIICGNGISGYGNTVDLKVKKIGNIYFCGDGTTDMSEGLCSSRVIIVANMQVNIAIELLVNGKVKL